MSTLDASIDSPAAPSAVQTGLKKNAVGMTGVVFTDAESLRAALVELGLLPEASTTRP